MRRLLLGLAILVSACGGGSDATGPSNPYPDVAGVYAATGRFDQLTEAQGHFTGTLTLTQASRQTGTLGGSATITATINGQVLTGTNSLQSASVSTSGLISFVVQDNAGGIATWTFTGQRVSGGIANGRHSLSDGSTAISGSWEATGN